MGNSTGESYMITRVTVPPDTYAALIQMQIDYYATNGNAGPEWNQRARADIASAFCIEAPAEAEAE